MSTLTPKQEKFAQGVASGMSQADAYRAAYAAGKMKPETVQVKASELMAVGKVSVRVRELQGEAAEKAVYTLVEHLGRLDDLSRGSESEGKYAEAIKAEELRGKAAGFYTERQQIDHTTGGEKISAPMSLTKEALEAIAKKLEE